LNLPFAHSKPEESHINNLLTTVRSHKRVILALLASSLLAVSASALSALDTDIVVTIEEPAIGESYAGISNLRGWAVAPAGTGDYYFSVYLDDEFAFYMPVGGARGDVADVYPDYPNSDKSGFSMAFNYKNLTPGEHEVKVYAYDNRDNYNIATATFTTERFLTPFIAEDAQVDLSTTENVYTCDKKTYLVTGVTIEESTWDFRLTWDRASQGFKIENIRASSSSSSSSCSYSSSASTSSTSSGSSPSTSSGSSPSSGSSFTVTSPSSSTSTSSGTSGSACPEGASGNVSSACGATATNQDCVPTAWNPCSGATSSTTSSATSSATSNGTDGDCVKTSWNDCGDNSSSTSSTTNSGSGNIDVYACITSPSENGVSSDDLVYFKNGLIVRNNEGDYWSVGDSHVVFETQDNKWFSIIDENEMVRLDVVDTPTSCFEYDYGVVTQVFNNPAGQKVLVVADDLGDTALGEVFVSTTCDVSVSTPFGYYAKWPDEYFVDFQDADVCKVLGGGAY
jgi:hypothetical protein